MHRITQGRCTPQENIHMTLAFVGAIGPEDMAGLLMPPAHVFIPVFRLVLDRWGCWPRERIGWAAPSRVCETLNALAANLADWLRNAGFKMESRPFTGHVTLVRHANYVAIAESMPPIEWPVREFALVDSLLTPTGARYRTLASWTLH
jgi:2'-5' RNA ligase